MRLKSFRNKLFNHLLPTILGSTSTQSSINRSNCFVYLASTNSKFTSPSVTRLRRYFTNIMQLLSIIHTNPFQELIYFSNPKLGGYASILNNNSNSLLYNKVVSSKSACYSSYSSIDRLETPYYLTLQSNPHVAFIGDPKFSSKLASMLEHLGVPTLGLIMSDKPYYSLNFGLVVNADYISVQLMFFRSLLRSYRLLLRTQR